MRRDPWPSAHSMTDESIEPAPARSGGARTVAVEPADGDIRLDRWFKRHFPSLTHGRLEKLLRTGQVRLDGRRAQASDRVKPGQSVRVPPLGDLPPPRGPAPSAPPSAQEAKALQGAVLYRDADMIALNKPPGLAVQGGSGVDRHLDGLLDALRFDAAERPRLVHRLDRDTSGVLLLARTSAAAAHLAEAFRGKEAEKLYWAVVVGVPSPRVGRINQPLAKKRGHGGERVAAAGEEGQRAITDYRTLDTAARRAAWLELAPVTGRTHQLRVHCVALGTPILGDGKYGGAGAFLPGAELPPQMHLHA